MGECYELDEDDTIAGSNVCAIQITEQLHTKDQRGRQLAEESVRFPFAPAIECC